MKRSRIFWRADNKRFYADLRDLGAGKRSLGTDDPDEAAKRLTEILEEVAQEAPVSDNPLLSRYAEHHLAAKGLNRRPGTIERDRLSIDTFIAKIGDVRLSKIDVPMLTDYVRIRRLVDKVAAQTVLHELHALSSLFRRAIAEGKAKTNPVRDLPDRPRIERPEAVWLEIEEAAALLESAAGHLRPLLGAFLLTGGRRGEIFGLVHGDLDFRQKLVWFRPNNYRTLKRQRHHRYVPLWPQLAELLGQRLDKTESGPLFPGRNGKMLVDIRGGLKAAVKKAKIDKHVTLHTLRHTYAAARIQCVDEQGYSIPIYTVMRELGHQSLAQIERTYGHLMLAPKRGKVVEYR